MGQLHIPTDKWLIIIIISQYAHIPKMIITIYFAVTRIMKWLVIVL